MNIRVRECVTESGISLTTENWAPLPSATVHTILPLNDNQLGSNDGTVGVSTEQLTFCYKEKWQWIISLQPMEQSSLDVDAVFILGKVPEHTWRKEEEVEIL